MLALFAHLPSARARPLQGDQTWRISSGGGWDPVWSPKGDEIFYSNGRDMMAVSVKAQPAFQADTPRALFPWPSDPSLYRYGRAAPFAVTPDGRHFLMVLMDEEPDDTPQIVVVPDWFEELRVKVPAGRD